MGLVFFIPSVTSLFMPHMHDVINEVTVSFSSSCTSQK